MKIGYQLFSALALCETKEGLLDTIRKLAELGYDGVEFFSYNDIPAGELKTFLGQCGIEACNSHVQLERWEADMEGELAYAKEAGIPCVTIPWMAPELRNEAGYKKVADLISELVPLCKTYGLRLMYHNHEFEFEAAEGGDGCVLDMFLDNEPALALELDTFWAHYAGVDPIAYMEQRKDRLGMIHVKDYESLEGGGLSGAQKMPSFCAVGTGKMDIRSIFDYAKQLAMPWVVVEQDNSKIDVLESAALSIRSLKTLGQ